MRLRRRSGIANSNETSWPGFVDALSSLLMVIIFLLSMFVLGQFFLSKALSGRDEALAELRIQITELGGLLKMERDANASLRKEIGLFSTNLQKVTSLKDTLLSENTRLQTQLNTSKEQLGSLTNLYNQADKSLKELSSKYFIATSELDEANKISTAAKAEIDILQNNISNLQDQLARLEMALEASEKRDREQQAVIVNLGSRLNQALASKVEELAGYRSEFFGRLKKILLGNRGIRIEGDRFVFASELLFASGSAEIGPEGRIELRKLAETLLELSKEIPADIKWILRIDGHTDKLPISNAQFKNNWELSAGRAISVVEFLIIAGVPAHNLAAAGFGQHQPLDHIDSPEAYARNRRIEMRLTDR